MKKIAAIIDFCYINKKFYLYLNKHNKNVCVWLRRLCEDGVEESGEEDVSDANHRAYRRHGTTTTTTTSSVLIIAVVTIVAAITKDKVGVVGGQSVLCLTLVRVDVRRPWRH